MPSDYVMNRIVEGATVKTTDNYESQCNLYFDKCKPINSASVLSIDPDTKIATVKTSNGRTRTINAFWLQLT